MTRKSRNKKQSITDQVKRKFSTKYLIDPETAKNIVVRSAQTGRFVGVEHGKSFAVKITKNTNKRHSQSPSVTIETVNGLIEVQLEGRKIPGSKHEQIIEITAQQVPRPRKKGGLRTTGPKKK